MARGAEDVTMAKKRAAKGTIKVREEESFDIDHLPKPGDDIKTVFSLRLDSAMVALIDKARTVYAEKIAAAIGRHTVPRPTRSAMIRTLIEDGLRAQGVTPPELKRVGQK